MYKFLFFLIFGFCFSSQAQNVLKLKPIYSKYLDDTLHETSGLIFWNNLLVTHNDDTDTHLYCLDTLNGAICKVFNLPKVKNQDWEEIAQDSSFIYVGDFGNNAKGNRKDLKILRLSKQSLVANSPVIDTISFGYETQTDFTAQKSNKTNFDCEAFVVANDSIFLFTKQWLDLQTKMYVIPKLPGNHIAKYLSSYNIKGLVTGAVLTQDKKRLVLCGYTKFGKSFLSVFDNFIGTNFLSVPEKRIKLKFRFRQIEGITTANGIQYYITNEKLKFLFINKKQQIHLFDLSGLEFK